MKAREVFRNRKWHLACLVLVASLIVSAGFNIRQVFDVHEDGLSENPLTNPSKSNYDTNITNWLLVAFPYFVGKINATLGNDTSPWPSAQIENFTWLNFTFTWGPESQRIVNGEFCLKVSIGFRTITTIRLTDSSVGVYHDVIMVVEADDHDYNGLDCMGFVFDTNQNGYIDTDDRAYAAFANGETFHALLDVSGFLVVALPQPSCHHAIFDPAKGYTFTYYPCCGESGLDFLQCLKKGGDNPLHICFSKPAYGRGVFVSFLFNIPDGLAW